MEKGASQRWSTWRGWPIDRRDGEVGSGSGRIPGGDSGVLARQDLQTAASEACVHREGQRQVTTLGDTDSARPGDPDGDPVDLEPIFEADFEDCSYGFRPGRSAHQALEEIRGHLKAGYQAVYDADLKGYFDSIPHDKLRACLRMRIADRSVLTLIRQWLEAAVVEPSEESGGPPRISRQKQGTPQGGVISPLLANLYLHWFDRVFHRADGPVHWAGAKLVRYADDFVVLAQQQTPRRVDWIETKLEFWMGLEINREKTRVVKLKQQGTSLDFLGFTFRYDRSRPEWGRHRYLNVVPSKKALARERAKLREMTSAQQHGVPIPQLIGELNRHLKSWASYFRYGYPRHAFGQINRFVQWRLWKHLRRRSQRPYRPPKGTTVYAQMKHLGLIAL